MQEKNDKRHCPKNNLLLSSLSSPLSPRLYSSALLLFVNLFVTPLHKTLLYSPLPHFCILFLRFCLLLLFTPKLYFCEYLTNYSHFFVDFSQSQYYTSLENKKRNQI